MLNRVCGAPGQRPCERPGRQRATQRARQGGPRRRTRLFAALPTRRFAGALPFPLALGGATAFDGETATPTPPSTRVAACHSTLLVLFVRARSSPSFWSCWPKIGRPGVPHFRCVQRNAVVGRHRPARGVGSPFGRVAAPPAGTLDAAPPIHAGGRRHRDLAEHRGGFTTWAGRGGVGRRPIPTPGCGPVRSGIPSAPRPSPRGAPCFVYVVERQQGALFGVWPCTSPSTPVSDHCVLLARPAKVFPHAPVDRG